MLTLRNGSRQKRHRKLPSFVLLTTSKKFMTHTMSTNSAHLQSFKCADTCIISFSNTHMLQTIRFYPINEQNFKPSNEKQSNK